MPFSVYITANQEAEMIWTYDPRDSLPSFWYGKYPITSLVIRNKAHLYQLNNYGEILHNPFDLDIGQYTSLTSINIYGVYISNIILPITVDHLTISNSNITNISLPPCLLYLSLYDSLGYMID